MGETYGAALIRDCLVDVLRLGMRVAFDGATGCGAVFAELRCEREVRLLKQLKHDERSLGMDNGTRKRFDAWMRGYNGVSARRLQRFL